MKTAKNGKSSTHQHNTHRWAAALFVFVGIGQAQTDERALENVEPIVNGGTTAPKQKGKRLNQLWTSRGIGWKVPNKEGKQRLIASGGGVEIGPRHA